MQTSRPRRAWGATQNLRYQSPGPERTAGRFAVLIALCALLPPVGVAYAWRAKLRGITQRLVLTLVGFVSLTAIFMLIFYRPGTVNAILPSPVVPLPFGYVEPTAAPAPAPGTEGAAEAGGELPEGAAPAPPGAQGAAEPTLEPTPAPTPEPITVYAVSDNATLYHAADTCDGQINRRSLTLDEAVAEGLTPCPKCNPPTPDGEG